MKNLCPMAPNNEKIVKDLLSAKVMLHEIVIMQQVDILQNLSGIR